MSFSKNTKFSLYPSFVSAAGEADRTHKTGMQTASPSHYQKLGKLELAKSFPKSVSMTLTEVLPATQHLR